MHPRLFGALMLGGIILILVGCLWAARLVGAW